MAFRAMNVVFGFLLVGGLSWAIYGQETVLKAEESKAFNAKAKDATQARAAAARSG